MIHLGLVTPLPPTPAGAAEYVALLLPWLEKHATVSCFVPDPSEVAPELLAEHRVRPLDERDDPDVDMLIYHIGNNPHHEFVYNALVDGPAGLVEVHDGSMHHYLQGATFGRGDVFTYANLGEWSHGWAGQRLSQMRVNRFRGTIELFLYDYLKPALDRSRGVIVHSKYAEELVQLRCPGVHSWLVPLVFAARFDGTRKDRSWTGVADETLLVANLGFVTPPKRPYVNLEALRDVLDRGLDAHLVFVGKDETRGELTQAIKRMDLVNHVTLTGFLDTEDLLRWTEASDVIVNLRAPHVGESSGSLAYGLAAGKPVVVQPIGSWAEFPDDVVVRMPVTDNDALPLADTIFALGQDVRLRDQFGNRAREFAIAELDPDKCVRQIVEGAAAALKSEWVPPSWYTPSRLIAARTFMNSGSARVEKLLEEGSATPGAASREALQFIPPARPHGRLLGINIPPRLAQVLTTGWGFEVTLQTAGDPGPEDLDARAGIAATTLQWLPLDRENFGLALFDVIIAQDIEPDTETIRDMNAALTPQGSLVILDRILAEDELAGTGFSVHMHSDRPVVVTNPPKRATLTTIATKALLPTSDEHLV